MTWAPLLLSDSSPCLRILVFRELLDRSENDSEVKELQGLVESDPIVARLLALQANDGSWSSIGVGGSMPAGKVQATSLALTTLGYVSLRSDHQAVRRGAEYLFAKLRSDGSWPVPGGLVIDGEKSDEFSMIPLQTAIPLRGLASCGYATDPRCEEAYEWLMSQRLDDGTWSTGKVGQVYRRVAGYRRLAHSAWGCRTNTTMALVCLALHPKRRFSQEARRALDLLLGRETRERQNVGFEVARTVGAGQPRGYLTYFAKFDLALILDLCGRIGVDRSDERLDSLVEFMLQIQGPYGLWEYAPHPEASKWVTFDILRSLSRVDSSTNWLSLEPRTPFKAYLQRPKRF
jgi:hypothetical protein